MRASTRVPGVSTNQRRSAIMHRLEHAEREDECRRGPDRARVAVGQRAVDDRLQHLRDRQGDELRR